MSAFSKWKERLTRQAGKAKLELHAAEPTYPSTDSMSADKARQALDQHIDAFIETAAAWNAEHAHNDETDDETSPFENFVIPPPPPPPPVRGIRVTTGTGKTQRFAKRLAQHIREHRAAGSWLYLVPTHRLGEDIAKHFRDHGLTATVYRGRTADDPNIPGNMERLKDERVKMCLNLEQVRLATSCGHNIAKSCCKNKKQRCEFYNECGYQQQLCGDQPDVWVAAHNMLHHPQKAFGAITGVVIDESFWSGGISGIESHGDDLSLEDINLDGNNPWREELVKVLRGHPLGGLQRACFKNWNADQLKFVIGMEWEVVNSLKLTPQMTPAQLAAAKKEIPRCRRARRMVGIWGALRELLRKPEIKVSGRLVLDKNKAGRIILRLRSVRRIVESCQVPTFLMDATLPDVLILKAFYPQVEIVADIDVEMPHVHVQQILRAPVSKRKLWGGKKKKSAHEFKLKAVRRYISKRWLETERKPMLVICQMKPEEWLKNSGLPDGIAIEHFNNISGIDRYKNVRSLILIGRTIPSPEVVEAYAGAITGAEPIKEATTGNWYGQTTRGIGLAAGGGIAVESDQHIDPVGEAVRWQICEGELLQALGRARGVNREAETPLDIDILADVVLPVTVNEVTAWQEPSAAVEMAVEGIMLTSPGDMTVAWPTVWANVKAAKRTLEKLKASFWRGAKSSGTKPYIEQFLYREMSLSFFYTTATTKFRRAAAFFDCHIVHPRPWLEARLGAIRDLFHVVRKGEIAPVGAEVGVNINEALVTVVKAKPRESEANKQPDRKALYGTAKAKPEWVGSGTRIYDKATGSPLM
jgi:hypothetical protein